jgi:hypothetical protein
MAEERKRGGKGERSMAHGEKEQGEREKKMAKEKVCEKDGRRNRAMIKGKRVCKKGESNGTRERPRSLGKE